MSVLISNNNRITMTRGDTLCASVAMIKRNGEKYEPVDGDSIRFALKRKEMDIKRSNYIDSTPLIVKEIPTDTLVLKINPEDTKSLGFGNYVYDISITYANGDVDTFIPATEFIISPEVD